MRRTRILAAILLTPTPETPTVDELKKQLQAASKKWLDAREAQFEAAHPFLKYLLPPVEALMLAEEGSLIDFLATELAAQGVVTTAVAAAAAK